jgi:hypothetical protein
VAAGSPFIVVYRIVAGVVFLRGPGKTTGWIDEHGIDPEYPGLLELAEACSMPVGWSCRTGVCHTCETGLLTGTVDYSPEPVRPRRPPAPTA